MSRTVLITGASTGIGRATALRLDSLGWRVLAGVRRPQDGEALRAAGSERIEALSLDVTDRDQIAAARERVGGSLDALVNNAGVAVGGAIELLDIEDLRRQLEINVTGQVAVTQAMVPALRAAKGRIVFIGSVGGRTAPPFASPYAASKFAVEAIADCLRVELRPWGIKVALLEPGSVKTPIWEKGRGQADEIEASITGEGKALYGQAISAVKATTEKVAARGVEPEVVAKKIEHAITSSRPRTRYVVGPEAKVQLALRGVLTDKAWDRVIGRVMGLPR
jgi:NAD(P)-dependent dehydrogenase (short-subunit alcohol dehydrogenase family)